VIVKLAVPQEGKRDGGVNAASACAAGGRAVSMYSIDIHTVFKGSDHRLPQQLGLALGVLKEGGVRVGCDGQIRGAPSPW